MTQFRLDELLKKEKRTRKEKRETVQLAFSLFPHLKVSEIAEFCKVSLPMAYKYRADRATQNSSEASHAPTRDVVNENFKLRTSGGAEPEENIPPEAQGGLSNCYTDSGPEIGFVKEDFSEDSSASARDVVNENFEFRNFKGGKVSIYFALEDLEHLIEQRDSYEGITDALQDFVWEGGDVALALLGLDYKSNLTSLDKAYKLMARMHHPDKGGDPVLFSKITRAYELVKKFLEA